MLLSFNNTRGMSLVDRKQLTLSELLDSPQVSNGAHVAQCLVFCVAFCRSLVALLFFFLWPLSCLSFLDLRLLHTNVKPFLQCETFLTMFLTGEDVIQKKLGLRNGIYTPF